MLSKEILMFFAQWGPGFFVLIGIFLFFRKLLSFVPGIIELVEAHQDKIEKQTEVLAQLKDSFKDAHSQHSLEHREMLVLLRYMSQKLQTLEERNK